MNRWLFCFALLSVCLLTAAACLLGPRLLARFNADPSAGFAAHYKDMVAYHSRGDGALPSGRILLLGSSMVQGLPAAAVSEFAVNYGIGGDTTLGLIDRLPHYESLKQASAIFLNIGSNDMRLVDNETIETRYLDLLNALPSDVPIICGGALPLDTNVERDWRSFSNERFEDWNRRLEKLCTTHGATYLPAPDALADEHGLLKSSMHDGDGLHLNAKGNAVWAEWIKRALDEQLN